MPKLYNPQRDTMGKSAFYQAVWELLKANRGLRFYDIDCKFWGYIMLVQTILQKIILTWNKPPPVPPSMKWSINDCSIHHIFKNMSIIPAALLLVVSLKSKQDSTGERCKFPFLHNGQTHYKCIDNGNHVKTSMTTGASVITEMVNNFIFSCQLNLLM